MHSKHSNELLIIGEAWADNSAVDTSLRFTQDDRRLYVERGM